MSDLEDVLNGEESIDEPANPVLTEEIAEDLKATEDPAAEEVTTPAVEETETIQEPNEVTGLKAGIAAERQKRQDLEQQLRTIQQQQQDQTPKPDFFENPDEALNNMKSDFSEQLRRTKVDLSAEMMRGLHDDYDQQEQLFIELGQQSPLLFEQMNQSANPAQFAYDYAKKHTEMQEIGDIDSYKAKIRAEVEAEFNAGKTKEIEAAIKQRSELPGSLSNERAAGGNTNPPLSSPELEQLIG